MHVACPDQVLPVLGYLPGKYGQVMETRKVLFQLLQFLLIKCISDAATEYQVDIPMWKVMI